MEFKKSNIFFIFIGLLGAVLGVQIDRVKIMNNQKYITYSKGSPDVWILQCGVILESGEELQQVGWTYKDYSNTTIGTYTWDKTSGGSATGNLRNVVNKTNSDLQFLELNYHLNGFYNCSATTNHGTATAEEPFEFLIVDLTAYSNMLRTDQSSNLCAYEMYYTMSPIFPKPTVRLGMYSHSSGGYYELVPEWKMFKFIYANKSVAYSYNGTLMFDQNTPKDATFTVQGGITKKDETFISIWKSSSSFYALFQKGCPAIDLPENLTVIYNRDERTCRGEVKLGEFEDEVEATITCMGGYSSNLDVKVICPRSTYQWEPAEFMNMTADVKCEKLPDPPSTTPVTHELGKPYRPNSSLSLSANFGLIAVVAFLILLKN